MHVVITGGAGFIGSHLAEELAKDHEITIIDNLATGRIENIRHLLRQNNVSFIKGSITDPKVLRDAIAEADGIFHFAAYISVPGSVANPLLAHETNITGTLNVLLTARDAQVKKVVFSSSAAVYGSSPQLPKHEGMLPHVKSPYAITKITGEYYCQTFTELYDLPTVCLRYFNVYGPRQDPHSPYAAVIPSFITRLLDGKPVTIYGDGEQTRDFVYIKDVVQANLLAMEKQVTGTFNIASGTRTSVNELARILSNITGNNTSPLYQAARPGDVRDSWAAIGEAQRVLHFQPQTSLESGLRETVRWFSTHQNVT